MAFIVKLIALKNYKLISLSLLVLSFAFNANEINAQEEQIQPWGYEGGTGPEHWGEIEHDHEKHMMCREGVYQSPIDINHVLGMHSTDLDFHYSSTPIQIINNGHTIHLNYNPGSFISWENERFELIQYHFHTPSEHHVHGKTYDMEVHLVHKTSDHLYVVVEILVNTGKHNPGIQKIWDRIPTKLNKEFWHENEYFNVGDLLPSTKEYFHYSGSLTTPPCSETVSWFILEHPIEVSEDQIRYFKKFIEHNARPTQKMHHRIVVKVE